MSVLLVMQVISYKTDVTNYLCNFPVCIFTPLPPSPHTCIKIKDHSYAFSVSGVCYSSLFRVWICFLCLLFAYMCMRIVSAPRSIAGVPSDRFQATLLLFHLYVFLMRLEV